VTWTHLPRPARVAAISAALALFLVGSNYCVIGAVRGTPMACTRLTTAQSSPNAATPLCPLHAARAKGTHGSKAPAQDTAPCCMTLARADAPEVSRIDAPLPLTALAVIAVALDAPMPAVATQPLPLDDPSPVPGWEKCAHAGRAPPALT
jgi:hypothetical protein